MTWQQYAIVLFRASLGGFILFVIITVFIAGLVVGHTPEYLGKKIQAFEIKMASLCIIIPMITIFFGSAITTMSSYGMQSMHNIGAQGFSGILNDLATLFNF
ncbi:MAG TPA: potassium-transporting ATPase subunit KdpA [Candidatus Berkiella sp.]|nr:potassium-transporting ATPase subunit KdpA [Candidatus Berkiella sp.]